jgi:hypothetical protein
MFRAVAWTFVDPELHSSITPASPKQKNPTKIATKNPKENLAIDVFSVAAIVSLHSR